MGYFLNNGYHKLKLTHFHTGWVTMLKHYLFCAIDPMEKVENIKMSVEKAKEAVHCDVKDGTSWCK